MNTKRGVRDERALRDTPDYHVEKHRPGLPKFDSSVHRAPGQRRAAQLMPKRFEESDARADETPVSPAMTPDRAGRGNAAFTAIGLIPCRAATQLADMTPPALQLSANLGPF